MPLDPPDDPPLELLLDAPLELPLDTPDDPPLELLLDPPAELPLDEPEDPPVLLLEVPLEPPEEPEPLSEPLELPTDVTCAGWEPPHPTISHVTSETATAQRMNPLRLFLAISGPPHTSYRVGHEIDFPNFCQTVCGGRRR